MSVPPARRGKSRFVVARAGLLVLLALPLLAAALPAAAQEGQGQEVLPRFEPSACPEPLPQTLRCGYLTVAENREQPGSLTLRLAVAILPSFGPDPAPDPIVYLEGRPGGSAVEGFEHWLDSPLLERRELIHFEQRGTRYAEPELDCPELKETYVENWQQGLKGEEQVAREVEAAARCQSRLQAAGVDLSAYHSAAIVADLEDLRQVLGYETWNLYGISYGTRLALAAMRDQPGGIRSAILDSTYPPSIDGLVALAPNTERVVTLLSESCSQDPACGSAYPNLAPNLLELIRQAEAQPMSVRVRHPDTGEWLRLPVDGQTLLSELFIAFYDSSLIPFLPMVIDEMWQGNKSPLVPLTDFTLTTYLSGSDGMNISVMCHEEVPFNAPSEIAAARESVAPELRSMATLTSTLEICGLWGAGQAGEVEDQPVSSDVPTLILAGQFDPITPPAFGREAARSLPNSFYFEFPGLGHGVTLEPCPLEIA
ncbi:MAG TPA: alpha/beta fold hydrolase, partial [Anaerolineae bacterium]|nr:alpha/beta fold hydrolase [Anaerolineae bacterium]